MKKIVLMVMAIAAVSMFTGCANPQWLVSNKWLGTDKTMKEIYVTKVQAGQVLSEAMGKNDNAQFYDYTVRVCNIDDNGTLSQCMDTVVLENVMQNTLYNNFMYQ